MVIANLTIFADCDYIKHSFCLIGTFMSAYSSHSYGVNPLNISTSSAYAIVSCFDVGVSSSPSNKTICSFFSTFPLIAGYEDFECK